MGICDFTLIFFFAPQLTDPADSSGVKPAKLESPKAPQGLQSTVFLMPLVFGTNVII